MNDRAKHDDDNLDPIPEEEHGYRLDADKEMKALLAHFNTQSPEQRAYALIKLFFQSEGMEAGERSQHSEAMEERFYDWLLSPADQKAKDKAMERVFFEMFDETDTDTLPEMHDMPASAN